MSRDGREVVVVLQARLRCQGLKLGVVFFILPFFFFFFGMLPS